MKNPSPQPFLRQSPVRESASVGAPPEFDFLATLRKAVSIKAAIAFGHMSGWDEIDAALSDSTAQKVHLLLGRSFFQTEPDLLDLLYAWQEKYTPPHFEVKLAPATPMFHPKVWVIEYEGSADAIVGSANLSFGGFASNTECSGYFSDPAITESLKNWFDSIWRKSSPLTVELCQAYRKQHEKTIHARDHAKKVIETAADELTSIQRDWMRKEAIDFAKTFFSSNVGMAEAKARIDAMAAIRRLLKPPTFAFTKADWLQFLTIYEFGSMKRIRKDTAQHLPEIKKAFQYLADDFIPLETRMNEVVNKGRPHHVFGIGRNVTTKILAMLNPENMPVYNQAVEETLRSFGYAIDPQESTGAAYEAFCNAMRSFVKECGQSEMLSIDAFFSNYFFTKIKK
jgi:HKD family nuclease